MVGALFAVAWLLRAPTLCTGATLDVFPVHQVVVVILVAAAGTGHAQPTPFKAFGRGVFMGAGGDHPVEQRPHAGDERGAVARCEAGRVGGDVLGGDPRPHRLAHPRARRVDGVARPLRG